MITGITPDPVVYEGLREIMKRYRAVNPTTVKAVEFELAVYRDGVEEVHSFVARPVADAGSMLAYTRSGDDAEKAAAVFKMMGRMLVNNDGVAADWTPEPLPKPKNAAANYQPKFRGPDGKLHTLDKASLFTDPAKGSSRRRWEHLVFQDAGVTVDIGVISEIINDLATESAEVPTSA